MGGGWKTGWRWVIDEDDKRTKKERTKKKEKENFKTLGDYEQTEFGDVMVGTKGLCGECSYQLYFPAGLPRLQSWEVSRERVAKPSLSDREHFVMYC